ncbi:MAG: cytochrome c oxidase assembly protein [Actinomycetota bacterium]|nr:cytochrome c oxidase assembly protein [Actinomycetota bacterium]
MLVVAPSFLAMGRPVATVGAALDEAAQHRVGAMSACRPARAICSPAVTSALVLATPWLLCLTPGMWHRWSAGWGAPLLEFCCWSSDSDILHPTAV